MALRATRWRSAHVRVVALAASLAATSPGFAQTAPITPPAPAPVAPPDSAVSLEARARYARGVALYDAGSYAEALVELERANALAPSYKLLYSIGLVRVQLEDFVGASSAFTRYLAEGADGLSPARRSETTRRLEELRRKVATLEIHVSVDGAEVVLDDVVIGVSPLATGVAVNPGRHKIVARLSGYRADALSLGVSSLDRIPVTLEPARETPPAPAPELALGPVAMPPRDAPAPVDPSPRESRRPLGAPASASWIGAGTFTVGAVVTGVLALQASSDLDARKSGTPSPRSDLDDLGDRAHRFAVVSDICLVGAVLAAGSAVYFTFVAKRAPTPASKLEAVARGLRVAPGRVGFYAQF